MRFLGVLLLLGILAMFFLASMNVRAAPTGRAHSSSVVSHSSSLASPGSSILGRPSLSAAFVNRVLAAYGSPASGFGQVLYDDGVSFGMDDAYALAFFLHESSMGTAGVARVTHSLGNIRCTPGWSSCVEGYRFYPSWSDGFRDWFALLSTEYIPCGLTTVERIIPVYAPASENDVQGYISAVCAAVAAWRAGRVEVA